MSFEKVEQNYLCRDAGCAFALSCLNCLFEVCIEDYPGGRAAWVKDIRDAEIKKLHREGKKVKELVEMFGVCERTITRVLNGK